MTKDELVTSAAEVAETDKADAERVIDALIGEVTGALAADDIVHLGPLGIFSTRQESAHQTHVPGQEGTVEVPAQKRILFHGAKALKDAVNAAGGE